MSNSPFWSAYASAVKNNLIPGIELPKDNEIFALPFTVPLTEATTPRTTEQVNYLLYNVANTTLASDGEQGHYIQELKTYLDTVDTTSLLDPVAEQKLKEAKANLDTAQDEFDKVEAEAKELYDILPPPKPPFEQWVLLNYPPYAIAQRTLTSSKTVYNQAYNQYWGRYKALEGYQENIKKALDITTLQRPYNMAAQPEKGDSTFVAQYSSVSLKDQLNSWIQGSGQQQVFLEVKVDSATPPGAKAESGIYLVLTTKGLGRFDINVGQWNVDNVKALYPNRETGASDVLNPKFARPISLLIAYAPKLEAVIKVDGKVRKLGGSATTNAADDKSYATVLGVLGQHFPPNPSK